MYNEIKAFAFVSEKKIYVEFEDGKSGIFDMSKFIVSNFFSALNNEDYFKQAYLEFGVITWPQGQDISPSTIEVELTQFELSEDIPIICENTTLVG